MKTFRIDKPITSCKVTKELIEKLEDYLVSQATLTLDLDETKARKKLTVTIVDGYGTSEVGSIKDEPFTKFSNDTSEVSVELRVSSNDKYFSVVIRFDSNKTHSSITINIEHDNAREISIGIYQSTEKLIEPFTTNNYLFHPPPFIDGVISGSIFPIFAIVIMSAFKKAELLSISLLILVTFIGFYISLGKRARPYTGFESQSLDNKDKWWDWFIKSVIGFIVFFLLLGSIAKYLSAQYFGL